MKDYFKSVLKHFICWTPALIFWTFIRGFGHEVSRPLDLPELSILQYARIHLALGMAAGIIFGSLDYVYQRFVYKKLPFGRTLLVGTFTYLAAIFLFLSFGVRAFTRILQVELTQQVYTEFIFSSQAVLLIVYCFIVGFVIDFVREVDKKFGPGNLWKMLKGSFYHPREEQRIFMFLDLKSSTAIAEKLGHRLYSELIQSCFRDISEIVRKYNAEVYQYVGDEIVLSWPLVNRKPDLRCLHFYYAFNDLLVEKKKYYESHFGLIPEFKAGLEAGNVMVAEVGEIKREIAYHGDVLNTASRIQDCCNQLNANLLISERVQAELGNQASYHFRFVGDIPLRGKTGNTRLYAVRKT